jgi:hypothetical protein
MAAANGEYRFAILQKHDKYLRVAVRQVWEPDEIAPCFVFPETAKFEDGIWVHTRMYFCGYPVYVKVDCCDAEPAGEWTSRLTRRKCDANTG